MSTIIVFDLDDTLYEERQYVESGLREVAAYAEEEFGWHSSESFLDLLTVLDRDGRGAVFDTWLRQNGRFDKKAVRECLRRYRRHVPTIRLNECAQELLPRLKSYPLYVVTDGNKLVQARKVKALGIQPHFRRVLITHRFGLASAKPSLNCFAKIKAAEACKWEDMIYVADNPRKDFVSLNKVGAITLRVLTGTFKDEAANREYDAQHHIPDLGHLLAALQMLGRA